MGGAAYPSEGLVLKLIKTNRGRKAKVGAVAAGLALVIAWRASLLLRRRRLCAGLFRVEEPGELRFFAGRQVWVHDPLGRGLVQLLGDEIELGSKLINGTCRGFEHRFDLLLDRPLDGAVVEPPFLILPE